LIERIDTMKHQTPTNKDVRNFGLGLLIITGIIGGFLLWRGRSAAPFFLGISLACLILALAWPTGLKPAYRFLMWLGEKLAWINTRIILALVFYLIFTPVGLITRLIGKDLLDRKLDPAKETYWRDRDDPPFDKESLSRQF
jgi:multisubunit Na+/H+ antiporter MnhG subunit